MDGIPGAQQNLWRKVRHTGLELLEQRPRDGQQRPYLTGNVLQEQPAQGPGLLGGQGFLPHMPQEQAGEFCDAQS